jgi:hypothetical protein
LQGYDTLQTLVPTCQQADASSHKVRINIDIINMLFVSVADPGCLSRISDPTTATKEEVEKN